MSSPVPFGSRRVAALSLVLVLSAVPLTHASAQDATVQQATSGFGTMQPIVVTPTLFPTPTTEIGNDVTVIAGDEIVRKQERTLPDALKAVPGLNVVQTGGSVGETSIFIRGTNSNHTKVLVDGVDVTDPSTPNGAFDFSQIPAWDIERIEVLRGPQSGLYGSDAIGGVINIITKTGKGPAQFNGMAEGGSYATFNQAAGVSGSQGRANYNFNVVHLRTADLPVTPTDLLTPGEARNDDFYSNKNYSGKVGVNLTDNFSLKWVGRYVDTLTRTTTDTFSIAPFTGVPEGTQSPTWTHDFFTRGEAKLLSFDGALENRFGVGYTHYLRSNVDVDPTNLPSTESGRRTKLNWLGTLHLAEDRTVLLGLEDETDRIANNEMTPSVRDRAGFAELHTLIVPRLYGTASVRVDDDSAFGKTATWRLAPAYSMPMTDTLLKASYGTGFKAPTLTQLYVGASANSKLQPEKSRGWDAGFEQPLLADRLRLGATYFHNSIKNLIVFAPTFPFQNINVNQATTYGVESFVAVKPLPNVDLRADYTYTVARSDTTGSELLRRPKNKASLDADWMPIEPLTLTGEILRVGTWLDSTRDNPTIFTAQASPYTLVNLAAEYRVNANATFFSRINNLLDRHYQEPLGFLQPGFTIISGIRVSWGGAPAGDTN
ncbi:MAG: TonB-dependent receptor [Alphaproteobacteria bacterium]|nr:TonB-dependent receptor [Alphaproteobacteria bacterium]